MECTRRGCLLVIVVIICAAKCEERKCTPSQFRCSDKTQCIPKIWQCDGEEDCRDKSDEVSCSYKPCTAEQFRCKSGKCIPKSDLCDTFHDCPERDDEAPELCQSPAFCNTTTHFKCSRGRVSCILKSRVCDGIDDCLDLSDEAQDCHPKTCSKEEFKCVGGGCISLAFKCDGKPDCADSSDERNCKPKNTCASGEFKCQKGSVKCIDLQKKCDTYRDCDDGSDERDCHNVGLPSMTKCPLKSDFYCGIPGKCITDSWRCDGEPDCPNGADERNCLASTCSPPKIACNKGNKCLHPSQKCDGKKDCPDGSDEEDCPIHTRIDGCKGKFMCGTSKAKRCVDWSEVCNGRMDCLDGEDERPGGKASNCKNNPCEKMNGGCTHICHNRFTHHVCVCPDGLQLQKDNRTCIDIDECSIWGSCSQKCENTKGSYKCTCDIGYVTDPLDKSKCKANTDKSILLATPEYIREYRINTFTERVVAAEIINIISVDYDIHSAPHRVFWTQPNSPAVKMAPFGGKKDQRVELFSRRESMPEGLAYDWVHNLLYFSDTGLKRIMVLNVSAPEKGVAVIATGDIVEPRAIAIDPKHGWLYWSDWTRNQISRVGMDGKYRKILVDSDMVLPNALAVDMPQNRLYWGDAKLHSISSVDLNGNDRRLIFNDSAIYPYSMSVFEDKVYWSDWHFEGVLSVNKFRATTFDKLLENHKVNPIRVMHKLMQPDIPNRCLNHRCSHFCLPSPSVGHIKNDPLFTCACPENMVLLDDDRTCRENSDSVMSSNIKQTTASTKGRLHGTTTIKPTVSNVVGGSTISRKDKRPVTTSPRGSYKTTKITKRNNDTIIKQAERVGHVAGIAMGVIFLIFAIVAAIMLIIYRVYSKRNIRSMNFDNPVYRKANGDADSEAQYPMNGSLPSNNRNVRTPIWTGMDNDAVEA